MLNIDDRILNEVTAEELFLMLHIARHMKTNEHTAFPSLATLCKNTKWSKPFLIKTKQKCIDKGLISCNKRENKNGGFASNIYTIETDCISIFVNLKGKKLDDVVNENDKGVVNDVDKGSKQDLQGVVNDVYPNILTSLTINKNNILSSSANSTSDTSISEMQKESQYSKDPDDPTGDTLHDAKNKKEKKVSSESKDEKEKIDKLILFFNRKTNSNYRTQTKATRKMILKLLRDGFNAKDFSDVILDRIKVWSTDEKMSEYLRPQTIFTEKNFESYLNNARKTKIEIIDNIQNDIQRLERLDPATLTNEELTILAKNGNGLAKQQLKLRR